MIAKLRMLGLFLTLIVPVDLHHLTESESTEGLPNDFLSETIQAVNEVWSICEIRFEVRSRRAVSAARLGVPYRPQKMDDLSLIAQAVEPGGYRGAIPFTVAGDWGLGLYGLGWAFSRNDSGVIDRVGAMIDVKQLTQPHRVELIAHELGHALSLPHYPKSGNVMSGGALVLIEEQCAQARNFAQKF